MVLGAPLSSLGGHLECLWDILVLPWEVIGLSFAGLLAVAGHAGHLKDLRVGFSFILCMIDDGFMFPCPTFHARRRRCKSSFRGHSYNKRVSTNCWVCTKVVLYLCDMLASKH